MGLWILDDERRRTTSYKTMTAEYKLGIKRWRDKERGGILREGREKDGVMSSCWFHKAKRALKKVLKSFKKTELMKFLQYVVTYSL